MDCPVCKNEPMIVLELDQVEVDHCLCCKGIWLDAGELELLLESTEGKDRLLSSFKIAESSSELPRKCPICCAKMNKVFVGNAEVLIDKCKKGHGIWFDVNELEEVIKIGAVEDDNKVLEIINDIFGKQKNA